MILNQIIRSSKNIQLSKLVTPSQTCRFILSNKQCIGCESIKRYKSEKVQNEWKDGAVVYSTSKASKHSVNKTVGFERNEKTNFKPLIISASVFCFIMYFMYIYDGEKNDLFDVDMSQFRPGQEANFQKNIEDKKENT